MNSRVKPVILWVTFFAFGELSLNGCYSMEQENTLKEQAVLIQSRQKR